MERREGFRPDAISVVIESLMPNDFPLPSASDGKSCFFYCNAVVLEEDKVVDNSENKDDISNYW